MLTSWKEKYEEYWKVHPVNLTLVGCGGGVGPESLSWRSTFKLKLEYLLVGENSKPDEKNLQLPPLGCQEIFHLMLSFKEVQLEPCRQVCWINLLSPFKEKRFVLSTKIWWIISSYIMNHCIFIFDLDRNYSVWCITSIHN